MDGVIRADFKALWRRLMEPIAEKPYSYNYDPPPGASVRNGQMIEYQAILSLSQPFSPSFPWI